MRPLIILHGWSDNSDSFKPLAKWLKDHGFKVVEIWLGDYLSMNDEITLFDLGFAFQRALANNGIPQIRHSFDLLVHSTGGLVAREYLRQVCVDESGQPDAARTPIAHLAMLAPANFGSPLAKLGKSVLGRFLKGWDWKHFGESGDRVLDALEIASPYSFALALDDLFRPGYSIYAPENTLTTVMVGTIPYEGLRSTIHENGTDGTVRVATANLNATYLSVDFSDPAKPPILAAHPRVNPDIALAVLHRNHGSIIDPDEPAQQAEWQKTLVDALTLPAGDYNAHVQRCRHLASSTFSAGVASGNPEWYHQYQHIVFRVHDQFGAAITDYVVEFYQENHGDDTQVMEFIHKQIIEKVTTNSREPGHRAIFLDTDDLIDFIQQPGTEISMSLTAAHISERILFRNPLGGVEVFTNTKRTLLHPNEPVLVDITLHRDPTAEVFTLKRA